MTLKETIIRFLIGDNKELVNKLFSESGSDDVLQTLMVKKMSFVNDVDIQRFTQDSNDIWSTVGSTVTPIRKWIKDRKSVVLRQNVFDGKNSDAYKMILNEWEMIESFMSSPIHIPQLPSGIDTSPELKTKDDIMAEWRKNNS